MNRNPPKPFGRKLHHDIPNWVDRHGAIFHIRISAHSHLTESPATARALLDSASFYAERAIWFPCLFLLMPDHLHALIEFHPERPMSRIVGDWKKWHALHNGVQWQDGYFDHRLRKEESIEEKGHYIRHNPVAAGFCRKADEWPWWLSGSLIDGTLKNGYSPDSE